jgi:hypothetical protein
MIQQIDVNNVFKKIQSRYKTWSQPSGSVFIYFWVKFNHTLVIFI